jgi:hypothetical protein
MREQGEAFLQKVWAVELPESEFDDGVSYKQITAVIKGNTYRT